MHIDFLKIVRDAWENYDPSRKIAEVVDVSARVSTNHVYQLTFENKTRVFAKLSYFGKYEHFVEDHSIINIVANNLTEPFDRFLSRSLMKGSELYVYRHTDSLLDAWVAFYNPVKIDKKLPARLDEKMIKTLGRQFARFHKACDEIHHTLPSSSKTLGTDLNHLLDILDSEFGQYEHRNNAGIIRRQCDLFFDHYEKIGAEKLAKIPVFVDWNIGNFSVTKSYKLFSRWDYDWFRMASRVLDFYFLSRIVSDVGDRTIFVYNIDPLMEDRFILFLKEYHKEYPLNETEIRFMKEVYRFFILNYVIKDGRYFFHELYATKLQKEAYEQYLPSIEERFDAEKILRALQI